ncbi:hypothetical protein NFI96_024382, partial [Prochilodus magdalenae]
MVRVQYNRMQGLFIQSLTATESSPTQISLASVSDSGAKSSAVSVLGLQQFLTAVKASCIRQRRVRGHRDVHKTVIFAAQQAHKMMRESLDKLAIAFRPATGIQRIHSDTGSSSLFLHLSVDPPRATLTVLPRWSPLYTGESVTLKCEIQSYSNWRYQWYKRSSESAVSLSQTHTFTVSSAADQDQYWCRGERDDRPTSSQNSDTVTLTVEGLTVLDPRGQTDQPEVIIKEPPGQTQVFTGETVTLQCKTDRGEEQGRSYYWYKDGKVLHSKRKSENTLKVTAEDNAEFICRTQKSNTYSKHSAPVRLSVSAPPKPTLTVEPKWSPLFTGESVTLTCEINPHVGRTYQFSKQSEHSEWTAVSPSVYHTVNGNTLTIRGGAVISGGQYRCRGEIPNRPASSQDSDSVTLTVEAPPKPTLTGEPKWSPLFTGESVTLKCVINTHSGRTYQWYKLYYANEWNEVSQSEYHTVNGGTLTIKGDPVISGGQYRCRGEIPNRPKSSQDSDSVTLTVEAPPKPTLTVEPNWSPLFTGESVTLKCVINTHSGRTYQWYKWSKQRRWNIVSRSEHHTVNGGTLTIRGDPVISGGQYRCRGEIPNRPASSQDSNSVTLTVEAPPKPTLTVDPKWSPLFTGESVTLKCVINTHSGRTYQWYKWSKQRRWNIVSRSEYHTVNRDTLTIRGDPVISGGQYYCRGEIPNRPASSQDSNTVTLTVEAPPKPTLTVEPNWSPLFTGESVTLTCAIDTRGGRTYQWGKLNHGNRWTAVSRSEYHTVNRDTLTIRGDPVISGGQYYCRGEIPNRPKSSQDSDSFTLTVEAERPKPELTSSHKGAAALIGNPVVLYCKVQSSGWKFYWSKQTQNPENETETETPFYTISSVSVSDRGEYRCRAERGDPVYYTNHSDALWITVTDLSPSVSLRVSPSRTQHFTNDSLSLSCEGQSDSTRWTVSRYTHSEVSNCSSSWGSVTGSTCNISSLSTSHTGVYWCESESGGSSDPVNITVHS